MHDCQCDWKWQFAAACGTIIKWFWYAAEQMDRAAVNREAREAARRNGSDQAHLGVVRSRRPGSQMPSRTTPEPAHRITGTKLALRLAADNDRPAYSDRASFLHPNSKILNSSEFK